VVRIHLTPPDLARAAVDPAPALQVPDMHDRDLYLDGRGIELQPSAFCWQVPTKLRDPDPTPVLVFPMQHAASCGRRRWIPSPPATRQPPAHLPA